MSDPQPSPQETADEVARAFFGVEPGDDAARRAAIRRLLVTALPLTRYLRGKATWVGLPLLVVVTLLPVWTVVNHSRDLWEGPRLRQVGAEGRAELYLRHTGQGLGTGRFGRPAEVKRQPR